jgi:hypothetical protein
MEACKGVLQAVNPDAVLFQVEVFTAQHTNLGSTQAVAVGNQKIA